MLTLLFLTPLASATTVRCALLPFAPYFRLFTTYYLTKQYWYAILSRVCHPPSSPGRTSNPSQPPSSSAAVSHNISHNPF